jgi:acyl carrier protein
MDAERIMAPHQPGHQELRPPAGGEPAREAMDGTRRRELLCSLFASVLGVPEVRIDDSFFDLDGQSLHAALLIGQINSALGVELAITDLFEAPTVAEFDRRLEAALGTAQQ